MPHEEVTMRLSACVPGLRLIAMLGVAALLAGCELPEIAGQGVSLGVVLPE
jgi:hypothetical protein